MRLLESTLSNEFLSTLFNEMREEGQNYVTLLKFMQEFDVYKRESNQLKKFKKIKNKN